MKQGESTSWEYLATEKNWTTLDHLARLAQQTGRTIPNVAMRWLLQSGSCDVVLLGGEKREYYEAALGLWNFRLSDEEVRELSQISEPEPTYPTNFQNLFARRESKFWGGLR